MPRIVGIRFRPVSKVYYFDPASYGTFNMDDRVIVETSRGIELGIVAQSIRNVHKSEIKGKLKKVLRRATPPDLLLAQEYRSKEPMAMQTCEDLATEKNIPLKMLKAEYSFDGVRLVLSFSAEQRIDFRDLVKDLTHVLKTRIEMKQVGARDETKMLDGYGRCGRRLCCSSWLTEFYPVSIRMAKNQGLPLAPAEISGLCGRLLCCLAYENEQYVEMRKNLPRVGSEVKTSEGVIGIVRGLNIIKETVLLATEEHDAYLEVQIGEIEILQKATKRKKERK